jgi:hypothetical protein
MKCQQLISSIYDRLTEGLERALVGLTQEDLNYQPRPDSNSIGWLTWHLTRTQDQAIADLMGVEQLWIKEGWYLKFNRSANPQDTGSGHSPEDMASFKSPDVKMLLAYYYSVVQRSKRCFYNLSETDLDREINHTRYPTVAARIVGVISDNFQHVGQMAYVHGLLKGKGWFDK